MRGRLTEQLLCGDEQMCDGLLDLGELLLGLGCMTCQRARLDSWARNAERVSTYVLGRTA